MELKLLDSKAISLSKFVGSERLFLNPRQASGFKSSPQFCSCTGVSPKASYLSTSNKAISPVGEDNFGVETFPYHINGTNGAGSSLFVNELRELDAFDDEYGGVVVNPERLPSNPNVFASRLQSSLSQWKTKGKKGVWLKLPLERSELVPVAVKGGFQYHHAERGYVMLTHWIPEGPCMLPANASHQVGVGGFVINDENEVLVVQEKHYTPALVGLWKIPTGFILESEEIFTGAVREVKEETGIDTEFVEVIAFRHAHNVAFEKSDLFFVCMLRPLSTQIIVDDIEIESAKWMPLVEFVEQPLIQEDHMFKKIMDICIARLGKRYCGLSAQPLVSKFDGKLSSLYYNIVEDQDFTCQGIDISVT
ncbi:nudix hydrolase homolog 8 [Actinidia rufa]|uniref:Nudix hydrolase homolog 8 n=1 Tax=Actinidia rufa TaxID=165716 RepID=A0A7J0DW69_9ERIC|nr:nudix hydrolase homolog 8 [Actinidia rufa]